ncbi:MAG: hypothetical protein NT094_01330, partial [Candidatus Staskawiczbacteria bacterium]|nr:hypothetical protein [Candidatus Staskawiczbacteria bacterium]
QQSQGTQLSDVKIDTLINFIAMIAAVFGVIVAIVLAFFTIRQLSVDREIKQYKEEIKRQKELFDAEVIATKKELEEITSWAKGKKEEVQKMLSKPSAKKTKRELEKLQEDIDKLRAEISYKQGSISSFPLTVGGGGGGGNIGFMSGALLSSQKICQLCKRTYSTPISASLMSICPYCGNVNT